MIDQSENKKVWAPKVKGFFYFLIAPFGCPFFNYIFVSIVLSFFINSDFDYFSNERLIFQLKAIGISFVILPIIGFAVYKMTKKIDSLRGVKSLSSSQNTDVSIALGKVWTEYKKDKEDKSDHHKGSDTDPKDEVRQIFKSYLEKVDLGKSTKNTDTFEKKEK